MIIYRMLPSKNGGTPRMRRDSHSLLPYKKRYSFINPTAGKFAVYSSKADSAEQEASVKTKKQDKTQ